MTGAQGVPPIYLQRVYIKEEFEGELGNQVVFSNLKIKEVLHCINLEGKHKADRIYLPEKEGRAVSSSRRWFCCEWQWNPGRSLLRVRASIMGRTESLFVLFALCDPPSQILTFI